MVYMSMIASGERVNERFLVRLWQSQLLMHRWLATAEGKRLRVLYPGRCNTDRGPDFKEAVLLEENDELLRGDVEIHVKASDWKCHGHHRDPYYNDVILHVVWRDDGYCTALSNGKLALVLDLRHNLDLSMSEVQPKLSPLGQWENHCCPLAADMDKAELGNFLDTTGNDRFKLKATRFITRLERNESAEQLLYEGIMEALGYTKNQAAFKKLARILTVAELKEALGNYPPVDRCFVVQSLLLGAAGLLPFQCRGRTRLRAEGQMLVQMESIWRDQGGHRAMPDSEWRFFRIRPENHPFNRMAAAAQMIVSYLEMGLVEGILGLVSETCPQKPRPALEAGIRFHPKIGARGTLGLKEEMWGSSLLGRGRAADIIVNVVLPFSDAWTSVVGDDSLRKKALLIYGNYPKLEQNYITRVMAKRLLGREDHNMVNSARRQQGLIHIYKLYCLNGGCHQCYAASEVGAHAS
jgi:hypothetical protein